MNAQSVAASHPPDQVREPNAPRVRKRTTQPHSGHDGKRNAQSLISNQDTTHHQTRSRFAKRVLYRPAMRER